MCKRQVLQQSWAQCFVVKNTQKLGTAFFIVAAFELSSSIRKEFWKRKASGEIAFDLSSLFHVQI